MKNFQPANITESLANKLIKAQFPEFAHFEIRSVEKQGHDNRTFRLGNNMLIRMPTEESYALKVAKEQELLPKLAPYLSIHIPKPIKMGTPSFEYPYPFSIYQWLEGTSLNLINLDNNSLDTLAHDLAHFLLELQSIENVTGPTPGQHNWWRGDHISVYYQQAKNQITQLTNLINCDEAIRLLDQACKTKWHKNPVWIHGDFAIGNMLIKDNKLSGIIDFGGMALGDPACDLVIAWTYLQGKSRDIFIQKMNLDKDTWLRAKAWALWKSTFELCQIKDSENPYFEINKKIIDIVLVE